MRETKDIRILVVEDEQLLRMAVVFDFKRRGFQVFEASNGREAFEWLEKNPVDIVLSDVRMPGGDGVELLERIKARDPVTPIVMLMTGFADLTLEEALMKGADTVFPKPFDRKALVAVMQEVIKPQKQEWSLRKLQHVISDFPVEMRYSNSTDIVSGRVMNLSRGGLFIVPDTGVSSPSPESKIDFAMSFNVKSSQVFDASGIVRHVSADHGSGGSGFGIDFDTLSASNQTMLLTLINDIKTTNFFSSRIKT